jgi:hypothetical protein
MQCRDVESILENEGLSPLPESVRAHASACSACSNLIADFSAILSATERLSAEVEPPVRVWVALRNQLEAEGVIRTPSKEAAVAHAQPSWWESLSKILSGRALATAAVGLVIVVGAYVQIVRSPGRHTGLDNGGPQVEAKTVESSLSPYTPNEPLGPTGQSLHQDAQNIPMVQNAGLSNRPDLVDASLRQNLASLNLFIEDCRRRLKEDPNDELAREYLSVAYQQKAELLSAMLDRGRSVN